MISGKEVTKKEIGQINTYGYMCMCIIIWSDYRVTYTIENGVFGIHPGL